MKEKKTILLVGGGTGGHIIPILNIQKEFKRRYPKVRIATVGGKTSIDKKLYGNSIDHIFLTTGKLHRSFTLNNIIQFFYLVFGFLKSFFIIYGLKPDIVFSKAGYVSFPIVFWAKAFNIPYLIHESDIIMGKANKLCAKDALKIFVGFPVENYSNVFEAKTIYVGQILRPEISDLSNHTFNFGFNSKKPVIYVAGGSQGSRSINDAIFGSLEHLISKYNLIHHTGTLDYAKASQIRASLSDEQRGSYFISELLTDADSKDSVLSAINQSELVITRASATTMGEVAALRKPIIAVPYKHAASDHQAKNAFFFQSSNAAIILTDDEIKSKLINEINRLFDHPDEMKTLANNAFDLLPKDGLNKVVEEIAKILKV